MIFLYLLDNNTSFVVLLSSFLGLIIELWKVRLAPCAPPVASLAHNDLKPFTSVTAEFYPLSS